jgi:hypothetical protein
MKDAMQARLPVKVALFLANILHVVYGLVEFVR